MKTAYRSILATVSLLVMAVSGSAVDKTTNPDQDTHLTVFILAGDEYVLEHGLVSKEGAKGTLESVIANEPKCAFLKDKDGTWATRDDVLLYDSHPITNNTKAEAGPVKIVVDGLGEMDGQSAAKSADYEKHLATLIRDLRKDLKQPKLTVVVIAMSNAKQKMTTSKQRVFDAQMTVGNPENYPEFAGNVISIDTRPMCRPPEECPGGRDRYNGHACSYLEIGEALAKAMLKRLPAQKR